jgi:hypothetical protein
MDEGSVGFISDDVDAGSATGWEAPVIENGKDEFGRFESLPEWEPIDFGGLTAAGREACYELLRRGDISWLLNPGQQRMLDWLDYKERQLACIVTSRQFGKTVAMLLYCLRYCITHPKHNVLFLAPHRAQLQHIMLPKLNFVFQFLPDDLLPHKSVMTWTFPNGSLLRLDGVSMGHGARTRGDTMHLIVMDECRDIDQLQNVIDSHVSPLLTTTHGKLIMISTPPESPLHAMTDFYIRNAVVSGDLYKATYKDNPLLSTKRLRYLLTVQFPNGEENHIFRREYMADWSVTDPERRVVREWNVAFNDEFFEKNRTPPNPVRPYIGLDFAHTDPCGIVGGYLDYIEGCLVITHEWVERKMNTDEVGMKIMEIEAKLKEELPGAIEPLRIMDIDPALSHDLFSRFNLRFEPAFKVPSILTMLNRLRVAILQGRVRVHPRCTQLRFQLAAGVFKSKPGSTEYLRTEKGGHLDLIDALKYVNLNTRWNEVLRPKPTDDLRPGQIYVGGFGTRNDSFRSGVIDRPV